MNLMFFVTVALLGGEPSPQNGLVPFEQNDKWGFKDAKGNVIVEAIRRSEAICRWTGTCEQGCEKTLERCGGFQERGQVGIHRYAWQADCAFLV